MASKSRKGFASMDPEKQRRIARLGGLATHRLGKAHNFTSEEAREAAKKGHASARRRRAKAKDRNGKE
jgi:general stress protein YciG